MIRISKSDLLKEPCNIHCINSRKAIFGLDKNSIVYKGLVLWCHLYHRRIHKIVNLYKETPRFIYFYGIMHSNSKEITGESFSKNVLNNQLGINDRGYATDKFVQYINRRYKALYTKDLFDIVQPVASVNENPQMLQNNQYNTKLRITALMNNIKNGIVHINYNYDPLEDPNMPYPHPVSKGRILLNYTYQYPYEQIPKNSWLLKMVKLWLKHRGTNLKQSTIGLHYDKNFIYFGMAPIPRKHMWKFKHPNRYSDVDYFILNGSGDGETLKAFVRFIRNSYVDSNGKLIIPNLKPTVKVHK